MVTYDLKIDDLKFKPSSILDYTEECKNNAFMIRAKILTTNVDRLKRMMDSEGKYPVYRPGEKQLRRMKVSKVSETYYTGSNCYDVELTEGYTSPFTGEVQKTLAATRSLLRTVPQQANRWFFVISLMFVITFSVGIGLILTSIVAVFLGKDILLTMVFAATGGVSIVTSLVTVPPLQLQRCRINFSQWTIAFYIWLFSFLNSYEFLIKKGPVPDFAWHEYKEINDYIFDLRERTLKIMEETCELGPSAFSLKKAKEKEQKGGQ